METVCFSLPQSSPSSIVPQYRCSVSVAIYCYACTSLSPHLQAHKALSTTYLRLGHFQCGGPAASQQLYCGYREQTPSAPGLHAPPLSLSLPTPFPSLLPYPISLARRIAPHPPLRKSFFMFLIKPFAYISLILSCPSSRSQSANCYWPVMTKIWN